MFLTWNLFLTTHFGGDWKGLGELSKNCFQKLFTDLKYNQNILGIVYIADVAQRKRSRGVKSHQRGDQLTGPFLEITRPPNLLFNKSIVSCAVWPIGFNSWVGWSFMGVNQEHSANFSIKYYGRVNGSDIFGTSISLLSYWHSDITQWICRLNF